MSEMKAFPSARLVTPLVVSALMAIACIAATGWALPPVQDEAATGLVHRLFGNQFVILIGIVGLWALFFGALQYWGIKSARHGVLARLAGQAGQPLGVVASSDPALSASLFAERWDHLAAIRLAPLSYATWVLPLLGFIGTVIGISGAIGDLGSVFADADREQALASVLKALQFAFDTTFVGLVLVIPVMALATAVSIRSDAARDAALAETFGQETGAGEV